MRTATSFVLRVLRARTSEKGDVQGNHASKGATGHEVADRYVSSWKSHLLSLVSRLETISLIRGIDVQRMGVKQPP